MFELVPAGAGGGLGVGSSLVLTAGKELFTGALQVGAPLITAVFAAQLVLAVLAKSVPTLNLFIEGPALTTSAGIVGLIASVNTFAPMIDTLFLRRFEQIAAWFAVSGG
jgi:flagellar biosynthetic protein FliR